MYKVYCGKDAAVMEYYFLTIIFLRISDDNIISIFKHAHFGLLGYVSGHGRNYDARADYCFVDPDTGLKHCNKPESCDNLENYKKDTIAVNDSKELIYTTYDGTVYRLQIAEESENDEISLTDEELGKMSLADKMRVWNIGMCYESSYLDNYRVNVHMDSEKYSAIFSVNASNNSIYCRFGAHGYCDKGYAMPSTICIRHDECRMIPDNTEALKGFTPDEKYFAENSCAFPPDGSWYWSVKSVDDNTVYLNGCGGDTYQIRRS